MGVAGGGHREGGGRWRKKALLHSRVDWKVIRKLGIYAEELVIDMIVACSATDNKAVGSSHTRDVEIAPAEGRGRAAGRARARWNGASAVIGHGRGQGGGKRIQPPAPRLLPAGCSFPW